VLHRPRLYTRLTDALTNPLTLVAGDAGFGKSTLMAGFLSVEDRPALWYRIDAADSDPGLFTDSLLRGLRPFVPRPVWQRSHRNVSLATDWQMSTRLILGAMEAIRSELIVVFDDVHLLAHPTLDAGLTALIEGLPHMVHLAFLTRTRPALPLARWGTQGIVSQIGTDDLRFTPAELRALLVDLHGLPLTDASLHLLAARMEGWAAGVVLALHAALAQGPASATQAIAATTGSSREIYDYLAEEAFARQPVPVQDFLLATGMLRRFSVDFANALLDTTTARETLDHLERSHLFLVPLDRERLWYRYHQLFAEFLQRVASERRPGLAAHVHAQAARLWEAREEIDEALAHYAAADEWTEVARLLARIGPELMAKGRFDTARRWLEATPAALWPDFPQLYLTMGIVEIVSDNREAAERALNEALTRLRLAGDAEGEALAAYWVSGILVSSDPQRLMSLADDLAGRLAGFPPGARSRALAAIGTALEHQGRLDDAATAWRQAVQTAEESRRQIHSSDAWRWSAKSLHRAGRFAEAIQYLESLAERTHRHGMIHDEAHIRLDLADVAFDMGRDEEAERHLSTVRELAEAIPCRVLALELSIMEGRAAGARGDHPEAVRLLERGLAASRQAVFQKPVLVARFLLSENLGRIDPARAKTVAEDAMQLGERMGEFLRGRAILGLGIATESVERCLEASEVFGRSGAHYVQALALVRAAQFAPSEHRENISAEAARVLGTLSEEGRQYVGAQGAEALAELANHGMILPSTLPVISQLTIRCLGQFEFLRNGVPVPASAWPRSASRRLLQLLVVRRKPVTREQIMEALWPDLDPAQAANQLRVALSHLRRVLEPSRSPRQPGTTLITAGGRVTLARARFEIDLDRFVASIDRAWHTEGDARYRALLAAVEAYGGDLLEDAPYEEWAVPEREELLRLYLDAMVHLASADTAAGRTDDAIGRWRVVVGKAPGDERAWRGLMSGYIDLGRRIDAIRSFEQCRAALADIGVLPSADTIQLRESIN
jgi:LuxR family maltose regulon positive regulatory protein